MDKNTILELLQEVAITAEIDAKGKYGTIGKIEVKLQCAYEEKVKLVCVATNQNDLKAPCAELKLRQYSDCCYMNNDGSFRVIKAEDYDDFLKKLSSFYYYKKAFPNGGDKLPAIPGKKFVGRKSRFNKLKEWIAKYKGNPKQEGGYLTYVGKPGCGKSAFAREIVVRAKEALDSGDPDQYGGSIPAYYFVPQAKDVFDVGQNLMFQLLSYYPGLSFDENKPFNKKTFETFLRELSKYLNEQNRIQLIVLDGVDQMTSDWFEFCGKLPSGVLCVATIRTENACDYAKCTQVEAFENTEEDLKDAIEYIRPYQETLDIDNTLLDEIGTSEKVPSFLTLYTNLRDLGVFDKPRDNDAYQHRNELTWWLRDNHRVIEEKYKKYSTRTKKAGIPESQALIFLGYCTIVAKLQTVSITTLAWLLAGNSYKHEQRLEVKFKELFHLADDFFQVDSSNLKFSETMTPDRRVIKSYSDVEETVNEEETVNREEAGGKKETCNEKETISGIKTERPFKFIHQDYTRFVEEQLREYDLDGEKNALYRYVCETLIDGFRKCCRSVVKNRKYNNATEYALKHRIILFERLLDLSKYKYRAQERLIDALTDALTDAAYFEVRSHMFKNVDFIRDIESVKRKLVRISNETGKRETERVLQPWVSFLKRRDQYLLQYPYGLSQEVVNEFEGYYKGGLGMKFALSLEKNLTLALKKRAWMERLWGKFPSETKTDLIQWSSDGSFFVTANQYETTKWTSDGEKVFSFSYDNVRSGLFDVSSDGSTLAVVEREREEDYIRVWDLRSEKETPYSNVYEYKYANLEKIRCSPDGSYLALIYSSDRNRTVYLWDVKNRERIKPNEEHSNLGNLDSCLDFSPDGSYLVLIYSSGCDKTVNLWDVKNRKIFETGITHNNLISCLTFSPDGSYLALIHSSGCDKTVNLWDVKNRKIFKTEITHNNLISCLTFSPDGSYLVTGDVIGKICVWNIKKQELQEYNIYQKTVCLVFSKDGKTFASGHRLGRVALWKVDEKGKTKKPAFQSDYIEQPITSLAFSDNSRLFVCDIDRNLYSWDTSSNTLEIIGYKQEILSCLSEKRLISGSSTGKIHVWSNDRKEDKEFYEHQAQIKLLVCSPNGTIPSFVSGDDKGKVCLWREKDGSTTAKVLIPSHVMLTPVFSPDNKRFAVYNPKTQTVDIYDLTSGDHKDEWKTGDLGSDPNSFFSCNGSFLFVETSVEAKDRSVMRVWDVDKHKEITPLNYAVLTFPKKETTSQRITLLRNAKPQCGSAYDCNSNTLIQEFDWETESFNDVTPSDCANALTCLKFSNDKKLLLTGDDTGKVCLWNFNTEKQICRWFIELDQAIKTFVFNQNQASVQLKSGEVVDIDVNTGRKIRRRRMFEGKILNLDSDGSDLESPFASLRIENNIQRVFRFQVSDGTTRYVVQDAYNNYGLYKLNESEDKAKTIRL